MKIIYTNDNGQRVTWERTQATKCNCCNLELEVLDGSPFCHYCYVRDCQLNPGKCENAQIELNKEENK